MLRMQFNKRTGYSQLEVLVVILIVAVLGGIVLVATQNAREAAARMRCICFLKQMGLAFHTYHDANNNLPSEQVKGSTQISLNQTQSFYNYLLPYIEQTGANVNTPIYLFLCPSRRTKWVGPRRDYGYGGTGLAGSIGTSTLDSPELLTLKEITDHNGTSKTALVSHVWMSPDTYSRGDPTDLGWSTLNNRRSCNTSLPDSNPAGTIYSMGSPHCNVMPFLFTDGHVQTIPYSWNHLPSIWAYDNPVPIDLP